MWKQGKENLQNNETGSLRRLQDLILKLQKLPYLLETYHNIISNITGGDKITDVPTLKDTAIQIFKEAEFVLPKWHSNFPELEENNPEQSLTEQTYANNNWVSNLARQRFLESSEIKRMTNLL